MARAASAQVPDRSRRNGRPRAAVARGRGGARRAGSTVTFAGSPDRAEARLVPEAGFELDTFEVSGLPRRPGLAQVRAVGKAMRAPRACRRILRARRAGRRPRRRGLRGGADGLRGVAAGDSSGVDGSGRASRAREPAGGAVRGARLPRVSDRGPRARSTASPAARSRRGTGRRHAQRAAGSSTCLLGRACCSSSAGARARRA